MKVTIDSAGRLLLPKQLRDSLGLTPGTVVDVADWGGVVQLTPGGRTAQLQRTSEGRLVGVSATVVTDSDMFALIDAGRK